MVFAIGSGVTEVKRAASSKKSPFPLSLSTKPTVSLISRRKWLSKY